MRKPALTWSKDRSGQTAAAQRSSHGRRVAFDMMPKEKINSRLKNHAKHREELSNKIYQAATGRRNMQWVPWAVRKSQSWLLCRPQIRFPHDLSFKGIPSSCCLRGRARFLLRARSFVCPGGQLLSTCGWAALKGTGPNPNIRHGKARHPRTLKSDSQCTSRKPFFSSCRVALRFTSSRRSGLGQRASSPFWQARSPRQTSPRSPPAASSRTSRLTRSRPMARGRRKAALGLRLNRSATGALGPGSAGVLGRGEVTKRFQRGAAEEEGKRPESNKNELVICACPFLSILSRPAAASLPRAICFLQP